MTPETVLLIADFRGRVSQRCEGGPAIHGEIWLKRHEGLLVVYWEAYELPVDEDNEPCGDPEFTHQFGTIARRRGPTRWQSLCVMPPERFPEEVRDLAAAFADPAGREALFKAAVKEVNHELYYPLGRGCFSVESHRWREGSGARLG